MNHHSEIGIDVPGQAELEFPAWNPTSPAETDRNALTVRGYPAIAGLDLSMTATGLAVTTPGSADDGPHTELHRIESKPLPSGPRDAKGRHTVTWRDRHLRMELIADQVSGRIPYGALVFLEAPSYGSTGAGTFDRSGLWWLVFDTLIFRNEARVVPVSPSQRMLYATGKGGGKDAGKDAVIAAVVRRYPDLAVTDNNVADAVVLMAMAARAAGTPLEDSIPAANLKAMDKLEAL